LPKTIPGAVCHTVLGVSSWEPLDLRLPFGASLRVAAEERWMPGEKDSLSSGRAVYPSVLIESRGGLQKPEVGATVIAFHPAWATLRIFGKDGNNNPCTWTSQDLPFVQRLWIESSSGEWCGMVRAK
jgi:hypothetical protein